MGTNVAIAKGRAAQLATMTTHPGFTQFTQVIASPALLAIARHWNQARDDKLMPSWADLSSSALAPHFQLLWGFQYDPQSDEFTGRLAGAHVTEWLGANFWGARLQDIHSPRVEKEARHFFHKIISGPAAGRCSGRLFVMGDHTALGERIALPLSSDGVHADAILGATEYEYVPVTGPVELIHENLEWFALR